MKTYVINENLDKELQSLVEETQQEMMMPSKKVVIQSQVTAPQKRNMLGDILFLCFLMSMGILFYSFFMDTPILESLNKLYVACIAIIIACLFLGRKYYFLNKEDPYVPTQFVTTKIVPSNDYDSQYGSIYDSRF